MMDTNKTIKVKITKAREHYWYFKHIGEVFEVYRDRLSYVLTTDYDKYLRDRETSCRGILPGDCEVVK